MSALTVDEKNLELKKQLLELKKAEFELEQRQAMPLAKSAFFPDSLKGDIASAVIIMELAQRMNVSVMEVAQSIFIIHGRPSFSTSFLVARLNQSSLIKGALKTIVSEDKQSAYCEAIDAATGETLRGMTITIKMAQKEGWLSKKGSKWQTMPELMLRKRAQSFFIKEFYPQVMYGMQTVEEIQDTIDVEVSSTAPTSDINAALTQTVSPEPEPEKKPAAKKTRKKKPVAKVQPEPTPEPEVTEAEVVEPDPKPTEKPMPEPSAETGTLPQPDHQPSTSGSGNLGHTNEVSVLVVKHYPTFMKHGLKRLDCNSFVNWAGLTGENIDEFIQDEGAVAAMIEEFKAEAGYA